MTYLDAELSRHMGLPIECYQFTTPVGDYLFTSADRIIVLPTGSYQQETIQRNELAFSDEDSGQTLEITVPRTNPVAALFIAEPPSYEIGLTIWRAHRGQESIPVAYFVGTVTFGRNEGSQAVLMASSILTVLQRQFPPLLVQGSCNHILFSDGCGANPLDSQDEVIIATVSSAVVTAAGFALRADGWFAGGRLVGPQGDERFIVAHTGSQVTLLSPLPGLVSLDVCTAYWGCDLTEATCQAKYDNLINFMGWARMPSKNPYSGGVD